MPRKRKPAKEDMSGLLERPPGSGRYSIRYRNQYGKRVTEVAGDLGFAQDLLAARLKQVQDLQKEAKLRAVSVEDLEREQERAELTMAGLVGRYEKEFAGLKSARMVAGYMAEWVRYFGEKKHPAHIVAGDVRAWQAEKAALKMKPGTINRYVAYLRRLFNLAIRDELLDKNPCGSGRVPSLRESGQRKRIISPEEEALLLPSLAPADRAAFILCLYSGMRQGEALQLRRADVQAGGQVVELADTKAGKEQTVHLNGPAAAAIKFMLSRHKSEFVFPNRKGTGPMSGARLTERLQKAAEKLGLPKVWFHSLRHGFVTRLGDGRTDIGTAQELARHSNVNQTRHYWHPSDERKRAAVESLAEGFQGWSHLATDPLTGDPG